MGIKNYEISTASINVLQRKLKKRTYAHIKKTKISL
jgi:hypothetical protein